jgi:putative ABC transport system permease protein
MLGRVFGQAEDAPGSDAVAVLSHRLWTRSFGADPSVIGREVTLDARPYTVVGVMPPSSDFSSSEEELWVPMAFTAAERDNRGSHFLTVHARLRDDVSMEQAAAQMPLIIEKRLAEWPDESPERTLHVTSVMENFVGEYRERLMLLFGAVVMVLLIACGNVSNLLLARGSARARELAVRSALGAGQTRLVRQLFTESLVLALGAAALGTALAYWLIELLITFTPPGVRRLDQARVDSVTLAFAVGLAVVSSIVFGLVPAWRASRADVNSTLKEASRGAGSRHARDYVRSTLIAAEVALALVLLVGAGLLIRTGLEVQRVSLGFEPHGVFTGRLLPPLAKYSGRDAMMGLTRRLEERLGAIPGVDAVALSNVVPGVRAFNNGLLPEGKALSLDNIIQTDGVFVTPAYFTTMGIPIVQGRSFDDTDRAGTRLVVILNRAAAAAMWPGEEAIGKTLTSANPLGPTTVIGIAEDVRIGGPSEPAPPTFYVPMAQLDDEAWSWARTLFIVSRSQGQSGTLGPAMAKAVAEVDPGIPVYSAMTMEARMAATIQTARFNTLLLTMLGGTGLLLAAVGIYGVIAYFATQRTSEIGIRLALGATRSDVVRLVLRQAALPVVAGIVLGGIGAAVASNAIASQLVNVAPTDPVTFATVAACLLLIGLTAALIPARRAASLDPTKALNS